MLPPPPRYFPLRHGRYSTAPELLPFGTDLGNGAVDGQLFQLDDRFETYRSTKDAARRGRPGRCFLVDELSEPVARAAVETIAGRLTQEHPDRFERDAGTLLCRLTGEGVRLDGDATTALDMLCLQVQEDLAVVRRTAERGEWNAALHVCAPSRWAPEEKLGQSFVDTHTPVPGMEKSLRAAPGLVDALVRRGPFVRFTWGLAFDERLDQHPDLPLCPFDGHRLWLRVERQSLWPLPGCEAALFVIRVHVVPGAALDTEQRALLRSGLLSMSPESRVYKGLGAHFDDVLTWLAPDS